MCVVPYTLHGSIRSGQMILTCDVLGEHSDDGRTIASRQGRNQLFPPLQRIDGLRIRGTPCTTLVRIKQSV